MPMQIYLTKPGGQKEGPYTLEQINRDLATGKFHDTDFWAWHEGLAEWTPLYSLPGVSTEAATAAVANPETIHAETFIAEPAPLAQPTAAAEPESLAKESSDAAETKSEAAPLAIHEPPSMSSGRPFSALEQIFVLTTGEGPAAFKSEVTNAMLQEAAGESLAEIRAKVPVDVIGRANAVALESIRSGTMPDSVWRALSAIKPEVVQQAQAGAYHLCIRTFPLESQDSVAVFLLYNKQKL